LSRDQPLNIEAAGWEAAVLPGHGGLIASLRHRGADVLRPLPQGSADPLASACYPLVPFANRIAGGRFRFAGAAISLPRNFPPELCALHGLGWQRPWEVIAQSPFKCAIEHRHDGAGPAPRDTPLAWPWAYQAQQRIRLGPKGCAVSLDVTNRSGSAMPAGLGLHPYFRRRPETRVRFNAGGVLLVGPDLIPTGQIAPASRLGDFAGGTALPDTLIDHCFTGWDGTATIEDDLGTITLQARGAPCLHVYAHGDVLCLEPVSHPPDALNQDPQAMTMLPPGCTASLQMWISASPR
jgi:aldose 1-epimerase